MHGFLMYAQNIAQVSFIVYCVIKIWFTLKDERRKHDVCKKCEVYNESKRK